jgi:hypothetical protein
MSEPVAKVLSLSESWPEYIVDADLQPRQSDS